MSNLSSNENLSNEFSNNLLREQGDPLGHDNIHNTLRTSPSSSSGGTTGASVLQAQGSTGSSGTQAQAVLQAQVLQAQGSTGM